MEIEKLLKFETTVEDKIEMIISNNFDIMYNGKAAVTIDKWDKLRMEILALHKSEVDKLNLELSKYVELELEAMNAALMVHNAQTKHSKGL